MDLTLSKIFSEEMIPPRLVAIALAIGFVLAVLAKRRASSPVSFTFDERGNERLDTNDRH